MNASVCLTAVLSGVIAVLSLGANGVAEAGGDGGPYVVTNEWVFAQSTDVYHVPFQAHQLALLLVMGDGETDLDLVVYDRYGNVVARDVGMTDTCFVHWVPAYTGDFLIEVINHGFVYNEYDLITN